MVLIFNTKMKPRLVFSCFLLVALFASPSESTILDEIEKLIGHALDVTFLKPLVDLLDPRNIIKSVSTNVKINHKLVALT